MTMRRLRNPHNGVQVVVIDDKAERLINEGTYQAVPDDEQPTQEPTASQHEQATARGRSERGHTSIASALREAVGPTWNDVTG